MKSMTDKKRLRKALVGAADTTASISLLDVLRVINEVMPEPKPKHIDGEPCELPVYGECGLWQRAAKGFRFVYTGQYRTPINQEWYDDDGGKICRASFDYKSFVAWVLRAIPVAPKWVPQVGEIIRGRFNGCVAMLIADNPLAPNGNRWGVLNQFGEKETWGGILIPATPAEIAEFYTVTSVDGKYRARFYQTEDGRILVVKPDQHEYYFAASHRTFNDAMLAYFGLTGPKDHRIMPFAQSQGKYAAPKEVGQ